MIEVIKDKATRELHLIEGKKIFGCEIQDYNDSNDEKVYFLTFWKKKDFDYVLENAIYPDGKIIGIKCPLYEFWNGLHVSVRVDFEDGFSGVIKIELSKYWRWDFSPQQYFTELSRLKGNNSVDVDIDLEDNQKFITSIRVFLNSNDRLSDASREFHKTFSIVQEYHSEALERLDGNISKYSLINSFRFPKELKTSCEQYLLYFAQFLQDLGINAISDIKVEAGKVLFSVTPTDDTEALDKIREALAIYLNLPASPIVYDESFAAMRLQQQIENLQHSQKMAASEIRIKDRELLLAQTVIEQQDNLIRQKDSVIEQQNKVIEKITSPTIMMDSLENKEELEEVCEGLKIGESEFLKKQLGIHLNPATFMKNVGKKFLGKDEKNSILDLDENADD